MKKIICLLLIVIISFTILFSAMPSVYSAEVSVGGLTYNELQSLEREEDRSVYEFEKAMSAVGGDENTDYQISYNGLWKYKVLNNTSAEIVDYLGMSDIIKIPKYVDCYLVEGLADGSFFNNTTITSVFLPASVTKIGWWAFYGCENLSEVEFLEGLKEISFGAFMNCPKLNSVSIPMSIDKISDDCFTVGCTTQTNVIDSTTGKPISTQQYTTKTDFVISGYCGTYAEKYAKDNEIQFISVGTVKFGDADLDGKITYSDIALIDEYINNSGRLSEIQKRNVDVDNNSTIDSNDIDIIKGYLSNDYSPCAFPAAKTLYNSENYLFGKSVYSCGDSVSKGTGTNILGNNYYSYCNYIADENNMTLTQKAVPGTTLAVQSDKTGNDKSITERVLEIKGDYDFILLEGGYNDLFQSIPLGTVTPDGDRDGNYDKYTTAGALETICYFLSNNYADTPKLFVLCHKRQKSKNISVYWNVIKQALDKWEIPYIDISEETGFTDINQTIADQYFRYKEADNGGDGTHPLKYAHKKIYKPLVEEKMNEIISKDEQIYAEKTAVDMKRGETVKLNVLSNRSNIPLGNCRWTSSDPSIVSVTDNGTATANKAGTVTLKACSQSNMTASCTVTVSSINLNCSSLILGVGESTTLVKTILSSNADQACTWSSSNATVASVSSNGKVTAKKTGSATITVKSSKGLTAQCKVTVKNPPTSVNTNPTSLTLGKGETHTISESTNSGSYANAANLKWSSSNTSVATVKKGSGNKATVTAKGVGTAYVKITLYNGKTAQCKVTVKPSPSAVKTNPASVTLGVGESYTISESTNSGSYANAANLKWTTSNSNVATVTKGSGNKAKITAKGVGTAYIKITLYNGKTAQCKVTVKSAPVSVRLSSSGLTLNRGKTYTISEFTNAGSYANSANLKWSSTNSSVASVAKGSANKAVITAKSKGTAYIRITLYNGKTAQCRVTVK